MTATPLQVLLFRHPEDPDAKPYEEAIVKAFQGGKEVGGYLASGEDLGVQLRVFETAPALDQSPEDALDSCCHTLTIVLVDRALLGEGEGLWGWLDRCWTHTDGSNGRHGMLVVPMDERVGRQFGQKRPTLEAIQRQEVHDLGELSSRPALLALRILHECRVLLAAGVPPLASGQPNGFLRLFISHAKADGLPLAHALKHQIQVLGWLGRFYDADDLPAGRNWQRELEQAVGSSLIVMLRSDVYDSRFWCQQEVIWADEYAAPAVLVDARTSLQYPSGTLPFDRVPTVRIPDGNLLRVLFLSLREGLRFLMFVRRVEEMKRTRELPNPVELRAFSYPPSMAALLRACRSLAESAPSSTPRMILYPDPPFRTGAYEAAVALVAGYAPGAQLMTPNTLAARGGAAG